MFSRIRAKLFALRARLLCIPKGYYTVTILLLMAALVIRFATGGTHMIYNVLQGRGAFPGPFAYSVLYVIRITLSGVVLTFSLYSHSVCDEGKKGVVIALLCVMLILLEYKLVFGGVSLVLAVTFAVVAPILSLLSVIVTKIKNKFVSVSCFALAFLQSITVFQLVSLAVCI